MNELDAAKHQRKHKKDVRRKNKRIKKLRILRVLIICVFIGLTLRIGYIKRIYGEDFERKAIIQQITSSMEQTINPNRGSILDRNKQSLAVSTTVYNIILDIRVLTQQKTVEQQNAAIVGLNESLDIPISTLQGYLEVTRSTDPETGKEVIKPVIDRNYFIIARKVPRDTAMELKDKNLSCVYLEEDTKRSYPLNTVAASIIGFVRGDTPWGLERQYDGVMRGETGRIFRIYDGEYNAIDQQIPAVEGNTIVTTIDVTLQQYAEDAVLKAGAQYNPDNAAMIIMNPKTGEILAMAQYPSFDLNDPVNVESLTSSKLKAEIKELGDEREQDDEQPNNEQLNSEQLDKIYGAWANFNITSTYEPGSIFKPVVVAAALEESIITPTGNTYYCGGGITIPGTDDHIPCWHSAGHGTQTLEQVLANSCNVGMIEIGLKLGRDKFFKYRTDFGYGEKTGIDLPGEADSGSSAVMYSLSQLNIVELSTSSMGQGFNNTPIQAINAFSALINGGNLMKPYMVSQVLDTNGNVIKQYSPTVVRKVISQETSDYLRKTLVSVVSPDGTAKRGYIEGYSIGGKTGTGQQGKRDDNINTYSFIAYLPAEDPEIIAIAIIDKPEEKELESSVSVVPMMTEVLKKIIQYKGISPSYETEGNSGVLSSYDSAVTLEDYRGESLQNVTQRLNALGLNYDFIGNGSVVKSQLPSSGQVVSVGTHVYLYLTEGENPVDLVYIPNVKGLTESKATELLGNSGLEIVVVYDEELTVIVSEQEGQATEEEAEVNYIVYAQMPGSESQVPKGTQIKLMVGDESKYAQ